MIGSSSAKLLDAQFSALDNAFQRANRYWPASMIGHDHLASIGMSPFLMTASLSNFDKVVTSQDTNDIVRAANGKALAHYAETSINLADSARGISVGSNQSSRASFALAIASSSVSPAEAQPGISGKTDE